jgi:hypothetical protein
MVNTYLEYITIRSNSLLLSTVNKEVLRITWLPNRFDR